MYAQFNSFELKITKAQAQIGYHSGSCDGGINELLSLPAIKRQLNKIDPEKIKEELKGYGAWSQEELSDVEQNKSRILWIACGDIFEEVP